MILSKLSPLGLFKNSLKSKKKQKVKKQLFFLILISRNPEGFLRKKGKNNYFKTLK
jgi:hypothetical protein